MKSHRDLQKEFVHAIENCSETLRMSTRLDLLCASGKAVDISNFKDLSRVNSSDISASLCGALVFCETSFKKFIALE